MSDVDSTPLLKRCTKCGNEYPATTEFFYRNSQGRSGLYSRCKTCHHEVSTPLTKAWKAIHPDKVMEARRRSYINCRDANLERARKYRASHRGRATEYSREYHAAHRDKRNACRRQRRVAHLDEEKETKKRYYAAHRHEIRERSKQQRIIHRDEINDKQKRWSQSPEVKAHRKVTEKARRQLPEVRARNKAYRESPEVKARNKARRDSPERKAIDRVQRQAPERKAQKRAYGKVYKRSQEGRAVERATRLRRRARKQSLPDNFTTADWQRAIDYFHGCCAVCGRQANDLFGTHTLAADHWIALTDPRPDNPGTVPWNMVPLCHGIDGCNCSKNNRDAHEWLIERRAKQHDAAKIERRIQAYLDSVREFDD